jgi:hypothetical protein
MVLAESYIDGQPSSTRLPPPHKVVMDVLVRTVFRNWNGFVAERRYVR